ncbi:hypothetical protein [Flavobacterium capsici]|uniref:Uncharacterized protein n=1 Tax=Flavobacterium capsici TaxID=3075618 RepID=A0AA96F1A4_9FLAO|nr:MULTISPECIES: hypothetical protein [unclassified Flavobacterium]WNM19709.1 hypothetical protein RN608_03265 [Flavobacterium sp. PMR2A8]WNM21098.1 hypothetical protein RN605_10435 [Flavobacterium sp. PMTSA4]
MNIIQLFEKLTIDKSRIGTLTTDDFLTIENLLNTEKESNDSITDISISNFLNALKYHPESFKAILENRVLYNFFTNKDKSRDYFKPETVSNDVEKTKTFVGLFFGSEIKSLFKESFEENQFYKASILAEAFIYFPDTIAYYILHEAKDRLDIAHSRLMPPYGDLSKIEYLKDANFYAFLNKIKTPKLEEKLHSVFELIINMFNQNSYSELAGKAFSAIGSYAALDGNFAEKIRIYRDKGSQFYKPYSPRKKNRTWIYVVVGAFVLLRVGFFLSTNSFFNRSHDYNNDDYNYDEYYEENNSNLDPYYTEMRFKIDSFHNFLSDFKASEIKDFTINSGLKSGDNPFETFYQTVEKSESNDYVKVKNNTAYDMVLLENNIIYDSIKMPVTAYYLKAGEKVILNSVASNAVFNIYIGKNLASFKTNEGNLFITNKSTVEYRFKELLPQTKELLNADFYFDDDVDIFFKNGDIKIDSKVIMD